MIYGINDVPVGTKAFVDGVEVKKAYAADPAEGWVEFYPTPFVIAPNNTVRMDTKRGTVVLVAPDGREFTE